MQRYVQRKQGKTDINYKHINDVVYSILDFTNGSIKYYNISQNKNIVLQV